MVMDGNSRVGYGTTSGIELNDEGVSVVPNPNLIGSLRLDGNVVERNYASRLSVQSHLYPNVFVPLSSGDSNEDYDFSDAVLKYINDMLMEEEMEDKGCMFQESAALQAAEKSFYDVLGEKYPPPDHQVPSSNLRVSSREESYPGGYGGLIWCPSWNNDTSGSDSTYVQHFSPYSSSNSSGTVADGHIDSPDSILRISDIFSDSQSAMQFKKGVEEASKFLPNGNALLVDSQENGLLDKVQKKWPMTVKVERSENGYSPDESRGKKNPLHEDLQQQGGRSNKQSAVFTESTVRSDLFDKVLLCSEGRNESDLRKALQDMAVKNVPQNNKLKGSSGGKSRSKKQGAKRNVVDLRTLLTLCAQAIAADDRRTANEFLKQIRQHCSPTGDGMQRLAKYFADGLEARMAGSGTQIYKALITMPTSAADVLKAYQLYLAACPFRKISNFFSNKTIWHAAKKGSTLHIIDSGILGSTIESYSWRFHFSTKDLAAV